MSNLQPLPLKHGYKGTQRSGNVKPCSFCMVSSGYIASRTEGGCTGMAEWTKALGILIDQRLIQGSGLKKLSMLRISKPPVAGKKVTITTPSCAANCLQC